MEEPKKKIKSARVISVIEVKTLEGDGTEQDPLRVETSYWSLEGERLKSAVDGDASSRYWGSSENPMTYEEWNEYNKNHQAMRCPD